VVVAGFRDRGDHYEAQAVVGVSILAKESLFHHLSCVSGADPGFFLGGGAPLRNGVTEYQLCQKATCHLRGRGGGHTPCTLPLDPPMSLHSIIITTPINLTKKR